MTLASSGEMSATAVYKPSLGGAPRPGRRPDRAKSLAFHPRAAAEWPPIAFSAPHRRRNAPRGREDRGDLVVDLAESSKTASFARPPENVLENAVAVLPAKRPPPSAAKPLHESSGWEARRARTWPGVSISGTTTYASLGGVGHDATRVIARVAAFLDLNLPVAPVLLFEP